MPRAKTRPQPTAQSQSEPKSKADTAAAAKLPRGAVREAAMALLRREQGATMTELTVATGWQPHSTRAVVSRLRKQGLNVTRTSTGGESCYRIEEEG